MSADTLPKKLVFKFGQVKGCRPPGRSRLSSMMLHQVTVMNVASPGDTNILRTERFGETRLVLHEPSPT